MAEQGKVFEMENDKVKVKMVRSEACKDCHACDMGKSQEMIISARALCEVNIGDTVEVHLENKDFLKATSIMYGIPLITLIFGFFIGYYLGNNLGVSGDFIGFISGILFLAITYNWIKSKESKWKSGNYDPVITKVVK